MCPSSETIGLSLLCTMLTRTVCVTTLNVKSAKAQIPQQRHATGTTNILPRADNLGNGYFGDATLGNWVTISIPRRM